MIMLYKKVDASSPDSISTGLDFFTTPPTNCAISNSSSREYLTVSKIEPYMEILRIILVEPD